VRFQSEVSVTWSKFKAEKVMVALM